jgi:hypothetical protein
MKKEENVRQAIRELIASDPDGDWDVASLCERIYGRDDPQKYYVIRRVIRDMKLPGTWRLGWRKKRIHAVTKDWPSWNSASRS